MTAPAPETVPGPQQHREGRRIARAKHPCPEPGCARPVPAGTSRCPEHTRTLDRARGTAAERGYGAAHRRERTRWQRLIDLGAPVACSRCGTPIAPGTDWHLDHTDDRAAYRGPSCAFCNLSAAGRARHGLEPKP